MKTHSPELIKEYAGRRALNAMPYNIAESYPQPGNTLTKLQRADLRRVNSMTYPRKGEGAAPWRSRNAVDNPPPVPSRRVITHGSQHRHWIWSMYYPPHYKIPKPHARKKPVAGTSLEIDLRNLPYAEQQNIVNGVVPCNSVMNGIKPLRNDCAMIVTWSDGQMTPLGKQYVYESVCTINFDGSGEYSFSRGQTVNHGAWNYGGTYRQFTTQFRCHRVLLYRDVDYDFASKSITIPSAPEVAIRPKPGTAGQPESETNNLYYSEHLDNAGSNTKEIVREQSYKPGLPLYLDYVPSTSYDEAKPDWEAIAAGISANTILPSEFTFKPSHGDPGDEYDQILPYSDYFDAILGDQGLKFDMVVEAYVYRWVLLEAVISDAQLIGFTEVDWNYLFTGGKVFFVF